MIEVVNTYDIETRINDGEVKELYVEELGVFDPTKATPDQWLDILQRCDRNLYFHCIRVSELAYSLGALIGLSNQDLDLLRIGSVFHDLGKITMLPLINYPGPLTPEDKVQTHKHPLIAYIFLSADPSFPRESLDVIRHHHERYDGIGYPDGLTGEEIPLMARITSVVDMFDALSSWRPYKPPWPKDEALKEILWESGRRFDPYIVDIAVPLLSLYHYLRAPLVPFRSFQDS